MSEPKMTAANNELKALMRDAQALFDEATDIGGARAEELRVQGMKILDQAISAAHDLQESAMRKGRKLAHDTDDYVHENPWRSIGIAGAVGLLIGMLIAKR